MTFLLPVAFLMPFLFSIFAKAQNIDEQLQHKIYNDFNLFANPAVADQYSNQFRDTLLVENIVVTGIAAFKRGNNSKGWGLVLTNFLIRDINCGITNIAKTASRRHRPHQDALNSFPSAHASTAFNAATVVAYDLLEIYGDEKWVKTLIIANYSMAAAVAWLRVEGGHHYPTDVIGGAFLGYATAYFGKKWIHERFDLKLHADGEKTSASISWSF
jgi:membrane-associated phospholipid phosphatase